MYVWCFQCFPVSSLSLSTRTYFNPHRIGFPRDLFYGNPIERGLRRKRLTPQHRITNTIIAHKGLYFSYVCKLEWMDLANICRIGTWLFSSRFSVLWVRLLVNPERKQKSKLLHSKLKKKRCKNIFYVVFLRIASVLRPLQVTLSKCSNIIFYLSLLHYHFSESLTQSSTKTYYRYCSLV